MSNPFDDLVPDAAPQKVANPFDDLIPDKPTPTPPSAIDTRHIDANFYQPSPEEQAQILNQLRQQAGILPGEVPATIRAPTSAETATEAMGDRHNYAIPTIHAPDEPTISAAPAEPSTMQKILDYVKGPENPPETLTGKLADLPRQAIAAITSPVQMAGQIGQIFEDHSDLVKAGKETQLQAWQHIAHGMADMIPAMIPKFDAEHPIDNIMFGLMILEGAGKIAGKFDILPGLAEHMQRAGIPEEQISQFLEQTGAMPKLPPESATGPLEATISPEATQYKADIEARLKAGESVPSEIVNDHLDLAEKYLPEHEQGTTGPDLSSESGAINPDLLTAGVKPFVEQDVIPTAKTLASTIVGAARSIRDALSPASASEIAGQTAEVMRGNLSEMARSGDIARAALDWGKKYFDRQPEEENLRFIDNYENGRPQVTSDLDSVAQIIRQSFDDKVQAVRDLGTGKLQSVIENYFPHIWKDPEQATNFLAEWFGKRPMEGGKAFLKQRSIPTTAEGIAAGLEPVSTNPVELALMKMREMDKYVMAHKTINALDEMGLREYVKVGDRPPAGYTKIDDSVGTVYGGPDSHPQGGMLVRGNYYLPDDAARIINNYLSPGLRGSPSFRAYLTAANIMNQAQLGFSAFHLGFTSLDAVISKVALGLGQASHGDFLEATKSFVSAPVAPITNILKGGKVFGEWMAPGSQGLEIAKIVDALVQAGGRVKLDDFYRTNFTDQMKNAFRNFNIPGAILRAPFAIVEQTMKPMIEYVVPRQKLGVFMDLARYEMERMERIGADEATVRTAMTKIWDSVDNRMGQLVYDNLFWDKTLKDLAMASVRSLGWNLGTIREIGGAGVDVARQAWGAVRRGETPEMTYRMQYAVALPLVVGTLGAITQYLFTGKGPEETKDYFFPKTGQKDEAGRDQRLALPSYMKDLFHWYNDPVRTAEAKLNPMLSTLAEMFENRNYMGVQIRNPNDPIMRQISDTLKHGAQAFTPFSIQGIIRNQQLGTTGPMAYLPFVGVTPAPADISRSPLENFMLKVSGEHRPSAPISKEQFEKGQLKGQIKKFERSGQPIPQDIQARFNELGQRELRATMKAGGLSPIQAQFKGLSISDKLKALEMANDAQRQQLRPIFAQAVPNAIKNAAPRDRPALIAKLNDAQKYFIKQAPGMAAVQANQ